MNIILEQPNKEIASAVNALLKASGTDLKAICTKFQLNYQKTHYNLNHNRVDLEWLKSLMYCINQNTIIDAEFNFIVELNEHEFINQQIK